MKKAVIAIFMIITCLTLFAVGCSQTAENTGSKESQLLGNESKESSPVPSLPEESPESQPIQPDSQEVPSFEISESDKISGWKELKATVYLSEMEADQGISYSSLPDAGTVEFLLHFPDSWSFNQSSVFYDKENHKAAELAPVALSTADIDELFQDYQPLEGELLQKDSFTVNEYKCLRLIEKVPVMNGDKPFWYPHIYLISDGTHIFTIFFYSNEINESDQMLFDEIVSSFRFE